MDLAGEVPDGFKDEMAKARITLIVDGETVLKDAPLGEFLGALSDPVPERSLFAFHGRERSCLFTAHKTAPGGTFDTSPAGYFLPRNTSIKAILEDVPAIPPGTVVRVGGSGFHYSPDQEECRSAGTCRT